MGRLFGTDGIRGVANQYPMTVEMAVNIGRAVASLLKRRDVGKPNIIIGRDTRLSGPMLEHALVAGICAVGGDARLAGVLPTPAVAFLATENGASAGIVISASHNPFQDNGIKIFRHDGFKLSDEAENEIEALLLGDGAAKLSDSVRRTGLAAPMPDAETHYIEFLKRTLPDGFSLAGTKVALDCSNGATYQVGPRVMAELGADIDLLCNVPDGVNINEKCGSQHPQVLADMVRKAGAAIGLAFDGDGDRLIAVDENGDKVTGDKILAICAKHMKAKGTLRNNLVVTTVMSNFGFRIAMKELGIDYKVTDVGDRYVMQEMLASGGVIGGEDSGHMIFLDHHTTGDGILTALRLLEVMKAEDKPLSELAKIMDVFPQILMNVTVAEKPAIESLPKVMEAIQSVESELGDKGRVLVRYSGTQLLCRVMVEGPTESITRRCCEDIVDVVKEEIGA